MRRKESWKIWAGLEDMELATLTGMQHRKTTEFAARDRPTEQSRNGMIPWGGLYSIFLTVASLFPRELFTSHSGRYDCSISKSA